ncbi:MAG: 8-oxo-dGTP diphosphatase [Candidatus Buchananbacteria bacterium]
MENIIRKVQTLCLIRQGDKILLGMKKRGFGAGRWNGFGGKVQEGESVEDATIREMLEESGLRVNDLKKFGLMNFEFDSRPGEVIEVHMYWTDNYDGELTESEEMLPKWYHVDEIPLDQMWPDDRYWMPLFLAGKMFTGRFLFGDGDAVLEKELNEILSLEK